MNALDIRAIRTDGGTQPRAQIDMTTLAEYAEDMANEAAFPPVVVFFDGENYWLADGFHRYHAALSLGLAEIDADLRQGTLQEAQWYSYSVNQSHGLRRSNDDKRRAVEAALRHPFAARYSDEHIAHHCEVHRNTVLAYRNHLAQIVQDTAERTVTRNGTTYTMNTANIGRREEAETQPQIEWQVAPEPPVVYQPMAATVYSHRSVEYYTPVEILEAARTVLGSFDLDPASCEEAQRNVRATTFYSLEDNGLSRPWRGRVWLNPPYGKTNGRSNQEIWAQRLVSEYLEGHVTEAVLLVKAALGYKWFEELFRDWPVCFARSRLSFILEDGNDEGQSKQGTALFYFGENVDLFARTFRQIGRIIPPEAEIDAALFGQ